MERHINMNEITDGKKYYSNDMVKVGCNDCEGCSACCHNMGKSIVLDPWDIYMLTTNLKCTFETLLDKYIELNVVEGMILPNLKLDGKGDGCNFLNEEGRCSIHAYRPGICRLFPLGRIYENQSFSYFLQTKECKKEKRTKIKINKWLAIPELSKYEKFVNEWHYFLKDFQKVSKDMEHEVLRKWNMYLLHTFFVTVYEEEDFYGQFAKRLEEIKCHI